MRFLLCDDDTDEIAALEALIREHYADSGCKIDAFSNPQDLIDYIEGGGVCDVVVLDIVMPEMNGTELAAWLRETGFDGSIIFLTTSRGYAPESYEVGASDYILKPIDKARLSKALSRVEQSIRNEDKAGLTLTTDRLVKRVLLKNIMYAEAGNHVVKFWLEGGEVITVRGSFSSYVPMLLSDSRFGTCHYSYVVNMDKVYSLAAGEVILKDGKRIPISRRYMKFKKQYVEWMIEDKV